jgi:shikimate kinase
MMGSGKSSIGALLACRLRRPFVDTDVVVEGRTGSSVAEIFSRRGEAAFRVDEQTALAGVLASPVRSVVATGGGAVLDPANRRSMRRGGTVVWLRASPAALAERLGLLDPAVRYGFERPSRPLLAGSDPRTLARIDAVRRPVYTALADVVVDVDGRRDADVVDRLVRLLGAAEARG